MEFKYANIDTENINPKQIEKEIERLTLLMHDYNNTQQALKIFINSIYGATGNSHFICYNVDVAEAVTTQGQDLIKFSAKSLNHYFRNKWHLDTELHKKLGLKNIKQVNQDVVVYADTDSSYLTLDPVINSIEDFESYNIKPLDFILQIDRLRLKEYLNDQLKKYAGKWNTKNLQDFELETISYAGIWLAKKKYMLDVAWKDSGGGIVYNPQSKIKSTGVEIVQSKTPKFARTKLKELVEYLFKKGNNLDMSKFISSLKILKTKFGLADIDTITLTQKITDYDKYVINDRDTLELRKGTPIHVRAAAIYNWKINNDTKLRKKYNLIKSGDKVRYYYVKNKSVDLNIFGYLPGNYPFELAQEFPVDYDIMFEKIILSLVNRIMISMNKSEIPKNLVFIKRLF